MKRIVADARELLESLSDEQRALAVLPVDDDAERRTWAYWPMPRKGLPLARMSADQAKATHHLVADVLSRMAVAKAHAIIGLEAVLEEIEDREGSRRGLPRDPSLYYLTIFGSPSESDPWSFRFEGHHVSIHITLRGEEVSCTPSFLGANPAMVTHGDRVVTRPLGEEEDAARDLLSSLSGSQRERAIISPNAPDDILTMNLPRVDEPPNGSGLPASELDARQLETLERLVAVYVDRVTPDVAGREMDRVREAGLDKLVFAWAGSTERGERHYYRVTGPTFLVEYDNTQNNANHVHAVWRDLERDFGADLLRYHSAQHHR